MKTRLLCLCLLFSTVLVQVSAQSTAPILTLAHRAKDTVILRWVPKNFAYWQYGREEGYVVERYEVPADIKDLAKAKSTSKRISPQVIKIADKASLQREGNKDSLSVAVRELLYPEQEPPKPKQSGFLGNQQKQQDEEAYMGFALYLSDLNPKVADLCALRFEDVVDTNKVYAYTVKFAEEPKVSFQYEEVLVTEGYRFPHPRISKLFVKPQHKRIQIRWDIQNYKGIYSAYDLQRSTDSIHFVSVSKTPIAVLADAQSSRDATEVSYIDSLDTDHQYLYYRVAGISPFATKGKYSAVVKTKGLTPYKPYMRITATTLTQSNTLYVAWKYEGNVDEAPVRDFWVEHAPSDTGPFEPLHKKPLASTERSYIDAKPVPINYYRVCAQNAEGQRACSMPSLSLLRDSIAPQAPVGLTATVNKRGLLQLKCLANLEQDILGYRVFYRPRPQADYIPWTSEALLEPNYNETISLNTLDRRLYLSMVAEDMNHNLSPYSADLAVVLPDVIAPMPPSVKHYDNATGKVSIRWQGSASRDVRHYTLQRDSDMVRTFVPKDDLYYEDQKLQAERVYAYRLCAVDSADNKGCTTWLKIKTLPMACPKILKLERLSDQDDEPNRIKLTWTIEKNVGQKYILYRKNDKGAWTPCDWIAAKATVPMLYEKQGENIGQYKYALQAECPGGNKSDLKEEK